MRGKKNYTAEFKAKVVLEALKNDKGIAEVCSEHKIPPTNLHGWRDRVLGNLQQLFISETEHTKKQELLVQEIESLHKVIGELTIENKFLKKKLQQ